MANNTVFRLLGVISSVVAAIELILVLERVLAALWRAYKFEFDLLSPIILDHEAVVAFYIAAVVFFVGCLYAAKRVKGVRIILLSFKIAIIFNVVAFCLITLLLVTHLARVD